MTDVVGCAGMRLIFGVSPASSGMTRQAAMVNTRFEGIIIFMTKY